jgi:hypothetical protein
MVQVVSYGSLPVARLPESSKRMAAMRFAIVACAAFACAAVVTFVSSSGPTVLYEGDPNPADLSDDQVSSPFLTQRHRKKISRLSILCGV